MKSKTAEQINPQEEFERKIFAADLGKEAPVFDLHGMRVDEALKEAEHILYTEFEKGTEILELIHGRGEGKLKQAIQDFLKSYPLVEYFRSSQHPSKMDASTFILLTRKKMVK